MVFFRAQSTRFCRFSLALLVVVSPLLTGCGDEEAERVTSVSGPTPPMTIDSGFFEVTGKIAHNGCELTKSYDATYWVRIDSSGFSMGPEWTWSWDADAAQASGESAHRIVDRKACRITSWSTVSITFTSEDEFSGYILYRDRAVGECPNDKSCQTSWTITGSRQ
jgi:hypothetical protein